MTEKSFKKFVGKVIAHILEHQEQQTKVDVFGGRFDSPYLYSCSFGKGVVAFVTKEHVGTFHGCLIGRITLFVVRNGEAAKKVCESRHIIKVKEVSPEFVTFHSDEKGDQVLCLSESEL